VGFLPVISAAFRYNCVFPATSFGAVIGLMASVLKIQQDALTKTGFERY
jgi:hypothetical protein